MCLPVCTHLGEVFVICCNKFCAFGEKACKIFICSSEHRILKGQFLSCLSYHEKHGLQIVWSVAKLYGFMCQWWEMRRRREDRELCPQFSWNFSFQVASMIWIAIHDCFMGPTGSKERNTLWSCLKILYHKAVWVLKLQWMFPFFGFFLSTASICILAFPLIHGVTLGKPHQLSKPQLSSL